MSQVPNQRQGRRRAGLWWRLLLLGGGIAGVVAGVWWCIHRYEVRQFVHFDEVLSVAFFSQGDRFVSGGKDGLVCLWETETGREVRRFRDCQDAITFVAVSPDDRFILAGSRDGWLRLWEPGGEAPVWRLRNDNVDAPVYPTAALFLPENPQRVVVAWFHDLAVYDVETRQRVVEFAPSAPNSVESFSAASQGRYVLIGPGPELQIRDTQTGQIVSERFPSSPDDVLGVHRLLMYDLLEQSLCPVFSPDGRYFASGNHWEITPLHGTPQRINDVVLWDASNWNEVRRFKGHERRITTVAFTADGRHIVSGSEDGSVRVWDRDSGAPLRVCWGHDWSDGHAVTALAIHPNQRQVLSASRDKLVRLWELP